MLITEVYDQYQIHQGLREHMLRVAGVVAQIADSMDQPIDRTVVISAALLHDMGNILKSSLDRFQDMYEPEGVEYYRKVKEAFTDTYGADEDVATIAIVTELNICQPVVAIIESLGFARAQEIFEERNLEKMLVFYADMRVGPYAVLSLDERLEDIKERYQHKRGYDDQEYARRVTLMKQIEQKLFSYSPIKPTEVTNQTVARYRSELLGWELNQ